MIPRYEHPKIRKIWTDARKFRLWLAVELAVLMARADLGLIPLPIATEAVNITSKIQWRKVIKRIKELEADLRHDLLAFVNAIQELLPENIRRQFHRGMTSYDTEEIPFALRLLESLGVVENLLDNLMGAIIARAREHKDTICIGETHGQHAEVSTFGVRLLGFFDFLVRDKQRLLEAKDNLAVGRLAGAIGIYTNLPPVIEKIVCGRFELEPASHSTQILHRDRLAAMAQVLALLATNLEHIAYNLWLQARTDSGEIREPFGEKQKGSSAMPHKKNPITLEKVRGLARIARAASQAILESVVTSAERDISQSCVERVEVPDLFHTICHMLEELTRIVRGMDVMPNTMLANINKTQGVIFSPRVKELFAKWEVDTETAYRLLQRLSFQAVEEGRPWRDLLLGDDQVKELIAADPSCALAIEACFDLRADLKHVELIFSRFK